MDARPIRDLLADLVGDSEASRAYGADPAGYLAANGHPDLPEPLLAEAVVSYADTAPVAVAEALAPYVTAHAPIPDPDPDGEPVDWFELLTSAAPADLVDDDPFDEHRAAPDPVHDWTDPAELDFGTGSRADVAPDHAVPTEVDTDPTDHDPRTVDHDDVPDWTSEPHFAQEPPIDGLDDEDGDDENSDGSGDDGGDDAANSTDLTS
jgi:hypothetical protein